MAIFGWFSLLVSLGYSSLVYLLIVFQCGGQWNIGGVPNSPLKRILVFFGLFLVFVIFKFAIFINN